jgi:hypothetical protein
MFGFMVKIIKKIWVDGKIKAGRDENRGFFYYALMLHITYVVDPCTENTAETTHLQSDTPLHASSEKNF